MKKALVTGGAGFIGRWVVKRLLDKGFYVYAIDNLSNGQIRNIIEFAGNKNFKFYSYDIKDRRSLSDLFIKFDVCYHLGASINVQDSIDDPVDVFENDAKGTLNILEECRKHNTKIVYVSTCMVYDKATNESGIDELSPTKAVSPYAGAKLAGEFLTQSYFYAYNLPAVIVRPFNTYGPFQKSSGEGGVVAIFIKKELNKETLNIYGDGTQTRDLLFVEDCAEFIVKCGLNDKANGEIINAGSGTDVSINELARIICKDKNRISHIEHIHPQSEISRLICDNKKAKEILAWTPKITLKEGIRRTITHIKKTEG